MTPGKLLTITLALLMIAGCGGGGGGGSDALQPPVSDAPPPAPAPEPTPEPEPGFASGTFEPYQNYDQLCENPRTGSDDRGRSFPDQPGSTLDENNWIRSWSHELYLWYDEITDVDPASLSTPDYFDVMRTFEVTPSGAPRDKFHFTIPTDEYQRSSQSGISGGYGVTFAVIRSRPPRQVVVAYTEPNTPATNPAVNIQRGAEILEVDGVDMVEGDDTDVLNGGLFPGDNETHTFLIRDTPDAEPRTVTMTSTQILSTPVQNVSTIETASGLVGYMTFNDHIGPAEVQLIDAIEFLQTADIQDLVLDLRYNGGGYLDIANQLAFMIAGPARASGRTFETLQFNDKHPNVNPITGRAIQPDIFRETARGFSASPGRALPGLGLSRAFVLTGPGTCSASESVINSLRGIGVEVVQIGSTTCGKPYGFYPADNCGTTYFSIQFRGVNDMNFGDYSDGFSPENTPETEGVPLPGCLVSDDFTRLLGDPLEGRLRAALTYREDGSCPSVISGRNARPHRSLSSVDGVVIKPEWLMNRLLVE
ncbi:MAG: S41 family peptidase [Proteobacteria bacterium]|nr:S41 family peptidase [Pseudomonadota bacterium]